MRLVDSNQIQWSIVSGHREGDIRFKRLINGTEGSPDNFELSLATSRGEYYTPRHRHNFEQIRLCLEGAVNYGGGKEVKAGQVGYFPEGAYYGPQNMTDQRALVLQFGGASGQGFMSYRQLDEGYKRLKEFGEFRMGVFHRRDGEGRRNQDGYEAVWEFVNGRKLEYQAPRYAETVLIEPSAFGWRAAGMGAQRKLLGVFSERELKLEIIRLEAGGSLQVRTTEEIGLGYVLSGALEAPDAALVDGVAFEIGPHEQVVMSSHSGGEIFLMTLPPAVGRAAAAD
ncbi:MAG: hypothetical protein HY246_12900 [Proteobacteria bacterium]|nr:hypothetical protein [Pseudomonadota bacterium]